MTMEANVLMKAQFKDLSSLNLGCGENHLKGYINVDKYGNPDILHDLESFPWPWEDNSVKEVQMKHVLEITLPQFRR